VMDSIVEVRPLRGVHPLGVDAADACGVHV
jgi:hypothetical protein